MKDSCVGFALFYAIMVSMFAAIMGHGLWRIISWILSLFA